MALKDLVAQKAALTEDAIEEIVSPYVRFDPEEKAISFTPAAAKLQNRSKLLVYLVALQGWPFVSSESLPVDAKPAELADQVGVPGGTLRPLLKELKDRHIIAERDGRYFVRPVSLPTIKNEILSVSNSRVSERRTRRPSKHVTDNGDVSTGKHSTRRPTTKKTGGLSAKFNKLIDSGFFDEAKSLAAVQKKFQKDGVIVPQSTVSPYLLKAVRAGRLTREEAEINKRRVWTYRSEE